uniref:DNA repair protein RecN n=1 Tax=uncultured Armatimonadetes bacterium TaxID=157466 RepID=A0A6J4J4W5_9BACT|nr:DNA repair protein RecN [uncultured Armatimonadetes bacterium]
MGPDMLTELSIENFALVEKLRLQFAPGLNILTGETGAGKSILMDALNLVLGERMGAESVRHGADRARVEAVFSVECASGRLREAMEAAGVEAEDGLLLLTRDLAAAGKSTARINGRPATMGMLKAIGDALVDIHGQHEHQSLLAVERHADILDAWCGPETLTLKAAVAEAHARAQEAARELAALQQDARERARTLDLLQFQRDEIDTAAPKPEEDEELQAERLRLASAEKLYEAASGAYAALHGGAAGRGGVESGGALDGLTTAVAEIDHAAKLDERLEPLLESLQNALYAAEEAARDVRAYRDEVEFNPDRLEEIEARLDVLRTLKRKYGDTLEEVLRYRDEIEARLTTLENAEERIAELTVLSERTRTELEARAAKLTAARKKAAGPFAAAVAKELADLAMLQTRFSVAVEPHPVGAKGADHVEFLLSPNPGEPLKPLARIASGGEISRVMLAMKSVLARIEAVPTLVFDEIDTGIGGRTGMVLADKLATLAGNAQILCITHLPQIAARGSAHLYIEKRVDKGRTAVAVTPLESEGRVQEIARMLGGTRLTDTVLQHAREMLQPA